MLLNFFKKINISVKWLHLFKKLLSKSGQRWFNCSMSIMLVLCLPNVLPLGQCQHQNFFLDSAVDFHLNYIDPHIISYKRYYSSGRHCNVHITTAGTCTCYFTCQENYIMGIIQFMFGSNKITYLFAFFESIKATPLAYLFLPCFHTICKVTLHLSPTIQIKCGIT